MFFKFISFKYELTFSNQSLWCSMETTISVLLAKNKVEPPDPYSKTLIFFVKYLSSILIAVKEIHGEASMSELLEGAKDFHHAPKYFSVSLKLKYFG